MLELLRFDRDFLKDLSLSNIPKNVHRFAWGFADENNRVGIVTEVRSACDKSGNKTGMYELEVVIDDPYICENKFSVTSFLISGKELEKYKFKPEDVISWDPVFGVPGVLSDEEIDRLNRSDTWKIDGLYLLYLEGLDDLKQT